MASARISKSASLLGALVLWAIAGAGLGSAQSSVYSVSTPLTPPQGWEDLAVAAINDSGQFAGTGYNGTRTQAFIATAASFTPIPIPAGWTGAKATAINNSGLVTGCVGYGDQSLPFIGTPAGVTVVQVPAGGPSKGWFSACADAINNSGQIVGQINTNPNYDGVQIVDAIFLGTADGLTPIGPTEEAIGAPTVYGINDSGQYVGGGIGTTGDVFIGTVSGLTMVPPPAGWQIDGITNINNSGQFAGWFENRTNPNQLFYQSYVGTAAGLTPIPIPAWATSPSAVGIGNSGQIVGNAIAAEGGGAWVGTVAGIAPIPVPVGWTVSSVYAISPNSGLILAYASNSSTGAAGIVVLTPSCQPAAPAISQSGAQTQTNAGGPWGGLAYDHLTGTTIAGRGSALTSLNMALNFLGQSWNPGTLNSLLDSVPGAYDPSPSAAVNWLPATAAANSGMSGIPAGFDDLGGWVNSDVNLAQAISTVEKGICGAGLPVIVAVRSPKSNNFPGHFVLVTGEIVNSDGSKALTINDPAYPTMIVGVDQSTANSGYTNPTTGKAEFWTRGTVRNPIDFTGLSVSAGAAVNLVVTDPNGLQSGYLAGNSNPLQNIPNSGAGVDEIDDDVTGAAGSPVQIVTINSPAAGTFQFSLTGTAAGPYWLQVAAEASDGSVQSFSFSGLTDAGTALTYQMVYSSTPGAAAQPVVLGPCNLTHAGSLNVADAQLVINEALGLTSAANDLSGDGKVNVVDVQIEINAALGLGCAAQ